MPRLEGWFLCGAFIDNALDFSTSYEYMTSSGDLISSPTPTCESDKSLRAVIDGIGCKSNFSGNNPLKNFYETHSISVVEFLDDAATLYAHDAEDKPVCVLVKKKVRSFVYLISRT
jgi:hypothetical protein